MTSNSNLLVVDSLSKTFGSVSALQHVSFQVQVGDVVGILGPNGAGKTTLFRCLAGILRWDAGCVRLGPTHLCDVGQPSAHPAIGYMPQNADLPAHFSVPAFLDYVALLKEIPDPRVRDLEIGRVLALAGLESQAKTRIRALSGGMKRRLLLAQALLGRPELLLLDEPTAGLDPEQRIRFRKTISDIANRCTVLLSTHQTDDVASVCSSVIVIESGSLLFRGPPDNLASLAKGQVWKTRSRPPRDTLAWAGSDGSYRGIGPRPRGARKVTATVEDGYFALLNDIGQAGA